MSKRNIKRKAYWIFDDLFILPTYLSVVSFLRFCDIPVVLVYYGKRIDDVKKYFSPLIEKQIVTIDYKEDVYFQLPIFSYNKVFEQTIKNRELRFYVAAQSGPDEMAYCFDSDIIFTNSSKELMSLDLGNHSAVCGCIEQNHTFNNKLYFERGVIHSNLEHIYPNLQAQKYNQIFSEETSCWLRLPQYNNGVLIFYNAKKLAEQWKKEHLKGLICPDVNPGEDQVTLTAAINKVSSVKRLAIPIKFNSMGQLTGDYAIFHATGGQWLGEILNAISKDTYLNNTLSDCAKIYRQVIQQLQNKDILNELSQFKFAPSLYHSVKGFFFFKSAYTYIYNMLPENSKFVEVGTYQGKSISYLAELVKDHKKRIKLYSIDNYCNIGYNQIIKYDVAIENLSRLGLSEYVTLIKEDSLQAAKVFPDRSIDCVFLDGDQRYKNVINDLNCWYCKVKEGGILAGNNYTRIESVKNAVDDFCSKKNISFLILEQSFIIKVHYGI